MAAASATKSVTKFAVADLQGQGKQLRHRGVTNDEYKVPMSLLRKATKGDPDMITTVHAITHHSWRTGAEQAVPKKDILEERKAPADIYTVGGPAGVQLAAAFSALQKAGVDINLLRSLWAVFSGEAV